MQVLSIEMSHPTSYARLQFIKAELIMQLKAGRKGAVAHGQRALLIALSRFHWEGIQIVSRRQRIASEVPWASN